MAAMSETLFFRMEELSMTISDEHCSFILKDEILGGA